MKWDLSDNVNWPEVKRRAIKNFPRFCIALMIGFSLVSFCRWIGIADLTAGIFGGAWAMKAWDDLP